MDNKNADQLRNEMEVEPGDEGWSSSSDDPPILEHLDDQAVSQRINRRLGMVMHTGSLGQLPNQPVEAQPARQISRPAQSSEANRGLRLRPVFERAVRQRTRADFIYRPPVSFILILHQFYTDVIYL